MLENLGSPKGDLPTMHELGLGQAGLSQERGLEDVQVAVEDLLPSSDWSGGSHGEAVISTSLRYPPEASLLHLLYFGPN